MSQPVIYGQGWKTRPKEGRKSVGGVLDSVLGANYRLCRFLTHNHGNTATDYVVPDGSCVLRPVGVSE